MSLVVAAFVFTFVFAIAAGAQETTDESADDTSTDSGQPLEFADGDQTTQAQAETEQAGPLAGTEVEAQDADQDQQVEVVTIPRTDCTFEEGASFVLQDGDGSQADFIDGVNIVMSEVDGGLEAVSKDGGQGANIVPLNERGGSDDDLGTEGLVIVTSTDITCEASGPSDGTSSPVENNPSPDNSATPEPEPQDEEKGPLEGGTAFGKDVLVPGDVIDILPDGTTVTGIDQIIIKTENCEFTGQGAELTITMSDRGVPFRIRDGDNADITLKEDGTIVANGRETLGETFPEAVKNNPDKIIVPIPVDPENDEFKRGPNQTFPIISSTGVGGEGCRALNEGANADDTNGTSNLDDNGANTTDKNAGDTASREDVISDTTSKKPLPNTGGVPLLPLAIAALFFASSGFLLLRSVIQRNA
jgi:hypothetical protein